MKLRSFVLPFFCLVFYVQIKAQSVGIGTTTPNANAALEITSNNKGIIIPRLTQAEINSIPGPPTGLVVYNTNTNSFYFYNGVAWSNITHSGIVTGTNNRVPRFSGAWGLTSGMMIDNNIGVSIKSPLAEADASAILDIQSSTKGLLIPRMTTAQRAAIPSAATGLLTFDNTTGSFWFKSSGNWIEITDTANNIWKRNGTHAYIDATGNVGIGITSPVYDLHISKPAPSIAFHDAVNLITSGTIIGNNANLTINAYRDGLGGSNQGNLILQVNSGSPQFLTAGSVGIGTSAPDVKLHLDGGTDASGSGGGYFQIGRSNSSNIGFDDNEIQARSNGLAGKLFLQASGGDLQIGGTNNIIINDGYQVYRNRPLSSQADLLPIAYGRVSAGGTALSGTGNLSVSHPGTGEYRIVLLGETNLYANRNQYTILVTINSTFVPKYIIAEIQNDDAIWVKIAGPTLNWTNVNLNTTCGCPSGTLASYLSSGVASTLADEGFSIVIYKM